jgi:eukaryotic-like serine/threonine-protein kinase
VASRPDTRKGNTAGFSDSAVSGEETVAAPKHTDPFSGRVLSHYRLEERLGSGGMGLLYRATDLALGRAVAVKLLARHLVSDESAKVRLIREARAASALDHPNIATIYDVGEHDGEIFIVMALYGGETLKQRIDRGPLPLSEALADLRQVALGLEAAHRSGIVHRDIKPANVFLTKDGTVKILDFGLAKLLSQSQSQVTQDGQAMGTVLYMSPEQLGGERVDARSDLWSLGVLAYEMLSGVAPFRADSNPAIATRILNDQPPSLVAIPGVPVGVADLVSQLLRKNPAERPPSATELLSQLSSPDRSTVASAVPPGRLRRAKVAVAAAAILALVLGTLYLYLQRRGARSQGGTGKSLVVLPFVNASGNADMEFLSDGIAESLIDNLSQIPELRVIARNTAFAYKGKDVDLQKLGREISVDTVLTGRVQQRGDTVTVHADLVNLAYRRQLWGERFSRKLTDLPALEESVANAISEQLRPRLSADVRQRLTKHSTESGSVSVIPAGPLLLEQANEEGF